MALTVELNPFTGDLQLLNEGTALQFKAGVANYAALPSLGNDVNDARITNDDGHLYIWDGAMWVDQGDILDLEWAAISGKPTSSPTDIDDAVSKRHTQGTDQTLDDGGGNETSVFELRDTLDNVIPDLVTKSHDQNTDTGTTNDFDITGELSIKVYSQASEPVLGQDNRIAMWIDTDDSNRVYVLFRRGSGDQVAVELS